MNGHTRASAFELVSPGALCFPQSFRDICYARVPDVWKFYESTRMLGMPTSVVYSYLTAVALEGTVHELQLVERIAKVEFDVISLGAFLRLVRYGRCEAAIL